MRDERTQSPLAAAAARPGRFIFRALAVPACVGLSLLLAATAFLRFSFDGGLRATPRFPMGEWTRDLTSHLPWVACFAALTAAMVPLRAVLWRFTLKERTLFSHRYHALALAGLVHNLLPGKLGEPMRAWLLSRRVRIPFAQSLASVLVSKLLEVAALLAVVAVGLYGPWGLLVPPRLGTALTFALPPCVGVLGLLVALSRYSVRLSVRLGCGGRFPRLRAVLLDLGEGLSAGRSAARLFRAFLAAFGPVLCAALAYGVAMWGLDVPRGLLAGGLVLGTISLGQVTLGLPVGIGLYYFLAGFAARSLGATEGQAAALATLTHLTTVATNVAIGLVSAFLQRGQVREILAARKRVARAAALSPATSESR